MSQTYARHSGADYADAFAALLPTGPAWPRDPQSALMRTISGLAEVWGEVDGRAGDLLTRETDPRAALELLAEWERAFGLPETCGTGIEPPAPRRFQVGISQVGRDALCHIEPTTRPRKRRERAAQTIADRRKALVAKIASQGGQSRAYFIAIAAALGFPITIDEFSPFVVGMSRVGDTRPYSGSNRWARCGTLQCGVTPHLDLPSDLVITGDYANRLGPPAMRFVWRVNVMGYRASWFRVASSRTGMDRLLTLSPKADRFHVASSQTGVDALLRISRADELECIFRRWKPAATEIVFNYGQVT